TPTTVNSGDMVRVAFNIRNQGTSSASANRQDIVLSTDADISAQDIILASVNTSTLAPQGTMAFVQNVPIPMNTNSGQFFIGIISDAGANITESSETNNTASAPITVNSMPDLRVSNFSVVPANITPGDSVRVEFSVANQGSADANAHIEEIRLSRDTILGNADDSLLRTEQTALLRPNANSRLSIDIRIPSNTAPGSYILGVITDARNTVIESDETNNMASMPVNVSGSLDLGLANLTLTPNTGGAATQVAVSFQLINGGSLSTSAVAIEVRFSNDQTITSTDPLLASLNSNPLNPGDTVTLNASITIPPNVAPGTSFIGVVADPRNLLTETNENNNVITSAFTTADNAAPVVRITSPNGNEIATAGGAFTIQWTATDDVAVVSQDIFLSTDGGANFNQVIVTGLVGTANSFLWNVPSSLNSGMARVQVVSRDAVGNLGRDNSDNNFIVGVRPIILGPKFQNGKLTFLVSNSNLPTSGSTLTIVNGGSRETYAIGLSVDGSKFVIAKKSTSSPSGISLKNAIPTGVPVMLIVTNPNGIASLPITFQR
ncbi:MAG: peptidase S8/S53 subtilisin kexin sedolisin, partial [bacterium]